MEIIVGKTAGFCYGVQNAVNNIEKKLQENMSICCLGEPVHNNTVIKKLEKMGLKIVDNLDDVIDKVIIRAHGITKDVYTTAKERNIEIFDYTCPSVLKIHSIAEQYANNEFFIFLIGKKDHPESLGTISFCGENLYVIESESEIPKALAKFKQSVLNKILIIEQTTFNMETFKKIVEEIKKKIRNNVKLEIKNTICNATKIRQDETYQISKKVNCMIIIGGKKSSNTKKLYDIAKEHCDNTFLIEDKDELPIAQVLKFEKIGIMAGASTPMEIVNDIIEIVKGNAINNNTAKQ